MQPQQPVLKLTAFTTNDGLSIASQNHDYSGRSQISSNYLINGKELTKTHHKSWFLVKGEQVVKTVQQPFPSKKEPERYVLKDSTLAIEGKIPQTIPYSEVDGYYDCNDVWVWRNCSNIQGLYTLQFKEIEGGLKDVEFEVDHSGNVEGSISEPLETKFKIAGKYQYKSMCHV